MAVGIAGCAGEDGTDTGTGTDGSGTDGMGTDTDGEMSAEGTALTLDNVGASAWEVTDDESGEVAPTGEENPTLTLSVGTRYVVENAGWSSHPLAFRAADDSPLLSQSADGSFEADGDVNWVDDDEQVAFTVTEGLAAELDYYICTVHGSMQGGVETA